MFSEESLLLIENWDTVEDMLAAVEGLRDELFAILESLHADLKGTDWWRDGWTFARTGKTQVYMSNEAWRCDDEYAVYIGVEGFSPEGVFGSAAPPSLYIWVSGERYELVQRLAEAIEGGGREVIGEIDRKPSSGSVVRQPVRKCLPGEVETYAVIVRKQILSFFEHYALVLDDLDGVIGDCLDSRE